MSDFDCLFSCAWRGEAPLEALTDWIQTRWDEGFDRLHAFCDYAPGARVFLTVYHPAGLRDSIGVAFSELALGIQEGYHFQRDTLYLLPGYLRMWKARVG